jgi:hypothetical protein
MSSSISLPVRVRTLLGLLSAGARREGGLLAAFAYLICMLASRCVRIGGVLGKSVVGMESREVLGLCPKMAARCLGGGRPGSDVGLHIHVVGFKYFDKENNQTMTRCHMYVLLSGNLYFEMTGYCSSIFQHVNLDREAFVGSFHHDQGYMCQTDYSPPNQRKTRGYQEKRNAPQTPVKTYWSSTKD